MLVDYCEVVLEKILTSQYQEQVAKYLVEAKFFLRVMFSAAPFNLEVIKAVNEWNKSVDANGIADTWRRTIEHRCNPDATPIGTILFPN